MVRRSLGASFATQSNSLNGLSTTEKEMHKRMKQKITPKPAGCWPADKETGRFLSVPAHPPPPLHMHRLETITCGLSSLPFPAFPFLIFPLLLSIFCGGKGICCNRRDSKTKRSQPGVAPHSLAITMKRAQANLKLQADKFMKRGCGRPTQASA